MKSIFGGSGWDDDLEESAGFALWMSVLDGQEDDEEEEDEDLFGWLDEDEEDEGEDY